LPALGGEAALNPGTSIFLKHRGGPFGAAAPPSAGKPVHYKVSNAGEVDVRSSQCRQ
jgi:hypothetical protein